MKIRSVRIRDVLQIERRSVEIQPLETYREIGLRSFGKGVFHKEPILGSDIGDKRVFHIEPGDLVVSNVFGWEGALAVATEEERGLIGSHRFMTWKPKTSDLDTVFAFHYLSSDDGLKKLRAASPGSAGRNRTLGIKAFENLEIPLPSIEQQRTIVRRLDDITGSSNSHLVVSRTSHDLWSIAQAVSAQWDREFGSYRRLGSIATVARGTSLRLNPESPVRAIGQASVRWNLLPERYKGIDESWASGVPSALRSHAGELLINSTGDGTIGRAALVDDNSRDLIVDSHVLRITTKSPSDAELIRLFLWSPAGRHAVERLKGSTTTKQSELGVARVSELKVPAFVRDQESRYRQEVGELLRVSDRVDELRASSTRLAKALPQAARNAEFARLVS